MLGARRALLWAVPFVVPLVAAVTVLLWPLHGNGVSGNALRPHYSDFGWSTYAPLPEHPSKQELREAGVALPGDVVHQRRRRAAGVGLAVLLLLGVGSATTLRRVRR